MVGREAGDFYEFKTSQSYIVRPVSKKQKIINKIKISQWVINKLRPVSIRITFILPNCRSVIELCQYKNVPQIAKEVAGL